MSTASARDSRIVRGGVAQSFDIGDQSNDLFIRNGKGGAVLYVTFSGSPDPEGRSDSDDTQRIPPGGYLHIPGGGTGPHSLTYVTSRNEVRGASVQTLELGASVNVDPGAVGVPRGTMEISPVATAPNVLVVGDGAGPLLIVNDSRVPVYLTVNTGTDPDTARTSTDVNTFELDGNDYLVVPSSGTGYEVRAQLAPYGTRRASLQLVQVV